MTDKTVFKAHIRDSLLKMGLLVEHFVKHELDIEEFEEGKFPRKLFRVTLKKKSLTR